MRSGFTLMELLVALTLVAALLTGIMGLSVQIQDHVAANKRQQERAMHVMATFERLEVDINRYLESFEGLGPQALSFIAQDEQPWAHDVRGAEKRIGYAIRKNTDEAVLWRIERDNILQSEPVESELLHAKEIAFAFFGEDMTPLPFWSSDKKAPVAVRLQIKYDSGHTWSRLLPIMGRNP